MRKEDLISNLDQEINVDCTIQADLHEDFFSPVEQQLDFLVNKFSVLKEIVNDGPCKEKTKINLSIPDEQEIINNPSLLKHILLDK